MVCRQWYQMANEQLLWQRLCRRNKWGVSQTTEQKQYARFTTERGCDVSYLSCLIQSSNCLWYWARTNKKT